MAIQHPLAAGQRKVVVSGASTVNAKVVADVPLVSCAAIIFGAIFIAFGPVL
jgi:hypothetical protein